MNARLKRMPRLVAACLITGIFAGAFVALFLTCAKVVMSFIFARYAERNDALTAVCIVTLALLCCFAAAIVQTLCPSAKGSGIPLAEGAARGMLRVKWLRTAAALTVGSMISFACGMPLGSEGPSVGVGGLLGDGVGKAAGLTYRERRFLMTGGSSAGLAAAFNAPLTGVCFAFEEAHRRFSPSILAAAFTAVAAAVATSQAIFYGFGQIDYLADLGIDVGFTVLPFLKQTAPTATDTLLLGGIATALGAACAAIGVAFNRAIDALGKLFSKVRSPLIRLLPAFATATCFGLILPTTVGSGEASLEELTATASFGLITAVLAMRAVSTATASGAGATGGLFLPMIAVGGLTGTLAAKLCLMCGLNAEYAPNIIMICVAAFFAASVRAPLTAITLTLELTASFTNLLPTAVAVAVAAMIAGAAKTEPLYERMMESMQAEANKINAKRLTSATITGTITALSPALGKRIRDVFWPYNSLVAELKRGEREIVPDGETLLALGDVITVKAEQVLPEEFMPEITELLTPTEKPPPAAG